MVERHPLFLRPSIFAAAMIAAAVAACTSSSSTTEHSAGSVESALTPSTPAQIAHGRDLWLTATFGGEQFFSLILPNAPFNLPLGFDLVLTTPRSQRFAQWGVINDPDCTDGNASTGGYDTCPDPTASGVVGVRKGPDPTGRHPFLVGVACAGCHAGLDPQNPPQDPNHPTWDQIHLTTGNQYVAVGRIFGAHLAANDPRAQVFHTWANGTVNTTAIESDGINNPGIITQFYDFPDRPYFTNHYMGAVERVHRAGQGGEDDSGCERAVLRVYFNIGMCAAECMVPHLANGPGGGQTPIDLAECEQICPEFVAAEQSVSDECAFIMDAQSTPAPKLRAAPGGGAFIDNRAVAFGRRVYEEACASCHSNGNHLAPNDILSDDLVHPASGFNLLIGEPPGWIGTNKCRSLTTNWLGGEIWAAFSSDELKARGPGYYRDVPLRAIWATAPFLHNNRLGLYDGDPSVVGRIASYEDSMRLLLNPWERDYLGSIQVTTAAITVNGLTIPKGTPIALFANLNLATGTLRCDDLVENGGHFFGWSLAPAEKYALTEYMKTL